MIGFSNIFWGLLGIVGGFFVVWKEHKIQPLVGTWYWAEKHLDGLGGTHTAIKLIGLGLSALGIMKLIGVL